jgi:hypothetical protein
MQERGKRTRVGVDEHCSGSHEFATFLPANTQTNEKHYGTPTDDVL